MARLELYRTLNGQRDWERGTALMPGVQAELSVLCQGVAAKARAVLAAHRDPNDGHDLHIETGRGDIDRSVSLISPEGQGSVAGAEFGHKAYLTYTDGSTRMVYVGASKGMHALGEAGGFL